MKFSCNTQELLEALQLVSRAIGGQQALPILGNVLLEVEGRRCTLSATDLELSIITSFEAKIENEGAITVPAKAILNYAQYNNDPEILLETSEGTQLRCTSEHARTLIAGESSTEYPSIGTVEKNETFSLDAEPLSRALHLVTFAAARTTPRPVLSGVYVRCVKGKLFFVATDSYRLSEYTIPVPTLEDDISCIIPTKILDELKTILAKGSEKIDDSGEDSVKEKKKKISSPVEVTLSKQQIELKIGNARLLSRLIEGKFPDYEQIIPEEASTTLTFPLKNLLMTVRRMHYFAKETNNTLTFSLKKNQVEITTPPTQAGRDEAILSVDVQGEGGKIALSSSYLLDFLAHVDGEDIEMQTKSSKHPALFRFPKKKDFLHLIMPFRLPEE